MMFKMLITACTEVKKEKKQECTHYMELTTTVEKLGNNVIEVVEMFLYR